MREFSREIYKHLDELPVVVFNKKTGELLFIVIKYDDIRAKDLIQSEK